MLRNKLNKGIQDVYTANYKASLREIKEIKRTTPHVHRAKDNIKVAILLRLIQRLKAFCIKAPTDFLAETDNQSQNPYVNLRNPKLPIQF